jgi:hypothetical protein
LEAWLRGKPGDQAVCRDGSAAYAEAIRRALPDAVLVSERRLPFRNLCDKVLAKVRSHAACWAAVNPTIPAGSAGHKVHTLLGRGVGLLDCSRRLGLALNAVKRYVRVPEPTATRIAPQYRPTLVDPYRDHLRSRRVAEPGVPVLHLFQEIKEQGCTGCLDLLHRYLNQGRAEGDRPVTAARRAARLLLTHLPDPAHPFRMTRRPGRKGGVTPRRKHGPHAGQPGRRCGVPRCASGCRAQSR